MVELSKVGREIVEWVRAFLRTIPGETGCVVRRKLYGFRSGPGTRVLSNVVIYHPDKLSMGRGVAITVGCQLNAGGGITIGDNTMIGPGSMIWSQNHRYQDPEVPVAEQGYERAPVVIQENVWVGAGCIILPGVHLARGTVVAAGSIVTKSTEPYSVVAGNVARQVGKREQAGNKQS